MTLDQCIRKLSKKFNVIGTVDLRHNPRPRLAEIFLDLKKYYRDSYQSNQRIIVILDSDIYNDSPAGLVLQSIQGMINDIDISNFFVELVTTNPLIESEYAWVLKTLSADPIPMNINACEGDYQQHPEIQDGIKFSKFIKFQSLGSISNHYDVMDNKHRDLLLSNSSFCMMPWVHLMINPDSTVTPCCENSMVIGKANQQSLKEIWNSDKLRQMRLDMLAQKPIASCETCYAKEQLGRDSPRQSINRSMSKHIAKTDLTLPDGSLEEFKLHYFDSRFDNLCNLSCRSCSHRYSSSWYQPAIKLKLIDPTVPPMLIAGRSPTDIFEQVMEHVNCVDKIYFAGGEPLINEQSYMILDELDKRKRYDVELVYNTNFTKSQYRGRSIFSTWNKFNTVSVGASLDGEYARGEYLRTGTHWNDVIANRKKMMVECPNVNFYVTSTASIINALHLPDFHRNWVESGLIKPEDYNIQILFGPKYMRVDFAPRELKQKIHQRYLEHLEWLIPKDRLGRATYGFESILKYVDSDNHFDSDLFWTEVNQLDQYHCTDLLKVFPELSCLTRNSNSVII